MNTARNREPTRTFRGRPKQNGRRQKKKLKLVVEYMTNENLEYKEWITKNPLRPTSEIIITNNLTMLTTKGYFQHYSISTLLHPQEIPDDLPSKAIPTTSTHNTRTPLPPPNSRLRAARLRRYRISDGD